MPAATSDSVPPPHGGGIRHILVVTSVAGEAESVQDGASPRKGTTTSATESTAPVVTVLASGVGMAAAAAATAEALAVPPPAMAGTPGPGGYDLVVSAGIGGGFPDQAPIGTIAVADAMVAADLGADSPDGFIALDDLGFGTTRLPADAHATAHLAELLAELGAPVAVGPVLTVSTVTGTARRAAELLDRHPGCTAEGMEGYGVAIAASRRGVPVVEVRTISNPVGPRDRGAWRVRGALEQLNLLGRALATPWPSPRPPR